MNVSKVYPATNLGIRDIEFSVEKGEVICILGKSGSGKSTLLRTIAGIEEKNSGEVSIQEGGSLTYVSQEYSLWPHLTVLENMILSPKLTSGRKPDELKEQARQLLTRFDMEEYAQAYASQLSGGQRQRVALLRAVMSGANVFLLDEVTSALDPELTKSVLDLIRSLAKDGFTMLVVTHHISFAMAVADRILFLENGSLLQDSQALSFFAGQKNANIRSFITDIMKKEESVEIFKGREQFQAYHMSLLKRLPEGATLCVMGAVGDVWYEQMTEILEEYEMLRFKKNIVFKMINYDVGNKDIALSKKRPELNIFRKMPRMIENPANYNVVEDTVVVHIFDKVPEIIEIRNPQVAHAYKNFFDEMWNLSTPLES